MKSDEIPFKDAQQGKQRILLSEFQGFGTPGRPLSKMQPDDRKSLFVELHNRIRQLAAARTDTSMSPASPQRSRREGKKPAVQRPRIRQVPFLRNRNFTGRDELLRQLHDELTSGQPELAIQALAGLGGIGKTQLALVRGRGRLRRPLVGPFGYGEVPRGHESTASGGHRRTMLIDRRQRDDHGWTAMAWPRVRQRRASDVIRAPSAGGPGRIIITSRYPAWGEMARVQHIDARSRRLPPTCRAARGSRSKGRHRDGLVIIICRSLSSRGLHRANGSGSPFPIRASPARGNALAERLGRKAVASVGHRWNVGDLTRRRLICSTSCPFCRRMASRGRCPRGPIDFRPGSGTVRPLAFDASIGALRRYSLIEATPDMACIGCYKPSCERVSTPNRAGSSTRPRLLSNVNGPAPRLKRRDYGWTARCRSSFRRISVVPP